MNPSTMSSPESTASTFSFVLLGASFGGGNRGVAALAAGTIAAVAQARPGARIFLLDFDDEPLSYEIKSPIGPVPVRLVNLRFSKKLFLRNHIARLLVTALWLRLVPSRRYRERAILGNPYLRLLFEADYIGAISGGDSFSDIYGLMRLIYVSLPQWLVLLLGKPLVLLPQTVGPFRTAVGRFLARIILRRAERIYLRDKSSVQELRPLLGERVSRVQFSYDVAFALEAARPSEQRTAWLHRTPNPQRPLIGLNVSGLIWMGGYNKSNMFGLKSDYRALVRELIRYFAAELQADVLLVPHVFGHEAESDTSANAEVCRALGDVADRVSQLEGSFDQHEIKYVIGRCDFFLGSRMHACIGALSQSVPAVCLAYSRKFIGVVESIGCEELVVDLCALSQAEILARVGRLFVERSRISQSLERRMPAIKASVLRLFSREEQNHGNGSSPAAKSEKRPRMPGEVAEPKLNRTMAEVSRVDAVGK